MHRDDGSPDDEQIQGWLSQLRDGTPDEKIQARRLLAAVFEQRGMYDEAIDLLVANVRAGERNADIFRWLARIYRAQGDEHLAMQAAAEAAKYMTPTMPSALAIPSTPQPSSGVDPSALQTEIQRYVATGYRIVSQTSTSA
jgi:tetratricopeptide (TPR) repeat protein